MCSRNGYDAIAIRSRAAVGNCIFGADEFAGKAGSSPMSAATPVSIAASNPGHTPAQTTTPAAEPAACARNFRRVVCLKTAPV